jgi:protein SCO1/2
MNPKPLIITGLVITGAGILVGLLGLSLFRPDGAPGLGPLQPDVGWEDARIPDFALVDQDGQPVDQTILDGEVTILDFIFTNCPLQCPAMTGGLWQLSEELKGTGVRFLSMSIDPERDTPERLSKYAADYSADPDRWKFLTGEKDVVRRIVSDSLRFEVSDNPESRVTLPDGSTMDNIVHPPHYILIGPQRQVLGIYWYQAPTEVQRLRDRARAIDAALR